ncbi:MAG TPA: right-handed parallel beta-helix repeat-containing protein [Anaeromyxobacteraceae bacterium]|nr:right-handed parallel beta-helix repeat-containing protein [Anaeromyxobacteraceae bacterium]
MAKRNAGRLLALVAGCVSCAGAPARAWGAPRGAPAAPPAGIDASAVLPADRMARWNPGILADGQLRLPLGPDRLPVRTRACARLAASSWGNGAADATAGIQKALDACPAGQVVQLSAGDYRITDSLRITRGIVLRGQGPERTRLRMPFGTNAAVIAVGTRWFKFTQSVDLAADAARGSFSATLASDPGLRAGELVAVDELADPAVSAWGRKSPPGDPSHAWFTRPERPVGQVLEVAAVRGRTVTFTTPFHIGFRTAQRAQLSRFSQAEGGPPVPSVKYAGIEDLYVSGGGDGNLRLLAASESWIRNVESDAQVGEAVAIAGSFRCVVRDSYFHSTRAPQPGGGGYGISFSLYSADNLVENNISWNMNKVMVMRASGGGNVIGYNYLEDGWISYATGWVEAGANASHMTTPHYELFEGNEAFNFDGDNTWGNAVYITVFRNHFTGKRRSAPPLRLADRQNRRAVGLNAGHWWYSFIGNVLGYEGMSPAPARAFTYEGSYPWDEDPVPMWKLGYDPENWSARADPKVLSTVLRDGNYDYVTREVHWAGGVPKALPDSLYLARKPAFFGDAAWPWVDPAGAVKLQLLPARARFDALHR